MNIKKLKNVKKLVKDYKKINQDLKRSQSPQILLKVKILLRKLKQFSKQSSLRHFEEVRESSIFEKKIACIIDKKTISSIEKRLFYFLHYFCLHNR